MACRRQTTNTFKVCDFSANHNFSVYRTNRDSLDRVTVLSRDVKATLIESLRSQIVSRVYRLAHEEMSDIIRGKVTRNLDRLQRRFAAYNNGSSIHRSRKVTIQKES